MFLDEAIFAGDPRTVAAMKSLINPQRVIEYKGLDKIYGHNYSKVIMASNNSYVANLEFDDRRHVYPDISRHRVGDRKYFNELAMEIENGGKEAFLKYMLEFTRNLDLCHIPEEGQSNQRFIDMRRSAEPPVKFALDLIFEGYELYEELLEEMQLLKAAKQWWDEGDTLYILKNDFVKLCNHYCDQSRVDRRWLDAQEIFVKLAKVNNMYATNQKSRERKNQCCLAVEQRLGKISIAIKDPERCREILGLTKKEE
jgi:hypothetical protein